MANFLGGGGGRRRTTPPLRPRRTPTAPRPEQPVYRAPAPASAPSYGGGGGGGYSGGGGGGGGAPAGGGGAPAASGFRLSQQDAHNAVVAAYRQFLGREPDAGGLAYWRNQVMSGQLSVAAMRGSISGSGEAKRRPSPEQQMFNKILADQRKANRKREQQARAKERARQQRARAELQQARRSAHAIIKDTLDRYGLPGLANWAWSQLTDNRSQAEIMLEMRQRPEFKTRFEALTIREQQGLSAISPEDVLNYEQTARDMFRSAGLPKQFYDNFNDFAELIGKGVSLNSVQNRLNESWSRVVNAPPEVRQAWKQLYGPAGDAALAAFMFDPDRNEQKLKEFAQTAVAGGAMMRFNFALDPTAAARVAGLDLADEAVSSGFARLDQIRNVFTEVFGETEDLTVGEEGIGAVFEGGPGVSEIEQRIASRRAQFGGGQGGALIGRLGLAGTAPS